MSVIKLKITASAIIEVETKDVVDYDGIEDYLPEDKHDDEITDADIAVAMVKWDEEEDSLPLDEYEWELKDIEVITNGTVPDQVV